jgi:hypothetical protein
MHFEMEKGSAKMPLLLVALSELICFGNDGLLRCCARVIPGREIMGVQL